MRPPPPINIEQSKNQIKLFSARMKIKFWSTAEGKSVIQELQADVSVIRQLAETGRIQVWRCARCVWWPEITLPREGVLPNSGCCRGKGHQARDSRHEWKLMEKGDWDWENINSESANVKEEVFRFLQQLLESISTESKPALGTSSDGRKRPSWMQSCGKM